MRQLNRWWPLSLLAVGGCAQILFGDRDDYALPVEMEGGSGASSTASASIASSSSSSGTAGMGSIGGMGGGGGGPVCTMATDCPATANECITVDCIQGACVETNVSAGTPTANQTMGDCKSVVCDGNGVIITQDDNADTVTDNKACTQDTCSAGMPAYPASAVGTACNEGGGKVCDGAGACVECNVGTDCASNVCQANVCQAAECGDMMKSGSESDVDCGGTCGGCADGKLCGMGTDCLSQVCSGGTCAAPSCTDMKKNGTETDVDCGSTCPSDCANGKGCAVNGDCQRGFCNPMTNMCAAPACNDGFQNGNETDTDCGGPTCGDCMNGDSCAMNGDCSSGYCNAMMTCAMPTCTDMVQNGNETDTDCGGPTCPDCMNGDTCLVNGDCSSGYCNAMMTCAMPTCTDSVQNGNETDVDCGGGTCPDCMNGDTCVVNGDCTSGFCNNMMTCATPTCMDMAKNGNETDVDCGGGTCSTCADGKTCNADADCMSGICSGGTCVANVNGCTPATAMDLTGSNMVAVGFGGANGLTYNPKCIKVKVGTTVTLNGNFGSHPTIGGTVVGATVTPASSGPFVPVTNSGTTKNFVMNTVGTFPYYCQPHATIGMTAAVFVVP